MFETLKVKTDHEGFTLSELMIATLILSVVMTGIIQVFINTSFLSDSTKNLTFASQCAQSKIDEIRNSDYASIVSTYDGATFTPSLPIGGTGSVSVEEVGAQTTANLLHVTVTINWPNKNRPSSHLDLETLIAKR